MDWSGGISSLVTSRGQAPQVPSASDAPAPVRKRLASEAPAPASVPKRLNSEASSVRERTRGAHGLKGLALQAGAPMNAPCRISSHCNAVPYPRRELREELTHKFTQTFVEPSAHHVHPTLRPRATASSLPRCRHAARSCDQREHLRSNGWCRTAALTET